MEQSLMVRSHGHAVLNSHVPGPAICSQGSLQGAQIVNSPTHRAQRPHCPSPSRRSTHFASPSDSIANLAALWSLSLDFKWYPHRRLSRRRRRRSGHRSYRGQSKPCRRCVGHAARWTAVARYQAVDSKRQRPGPVRLGYHRAICTGNRSQATADAGSHLWRD